MKGLATVYAIAPRVLALAAFATAVVVGTQGDVVPEQAGESKDWRSA